MNVPQTLLMRVPKRQVLCNVYKTSFVNHTACDLEAQGESVRAATQDWGAEIFRPLGEKVADGR